MEELIVKIEEILKRELGNLRTEFKQDNEKLRNDLRTEFKQENEKLRNDLRTEFKQENEKLRNDLRIEFKQENEKLRNDLRLEFKQDNENLKTELQQEIKEIRDSLFIIEHEHGRKIDAMYDLLMLQNEKNQEKFEEMNKLNRRVNLAELNILNHEERITVLEKSNS